MNSSPSVLLFSLSMTHPCVDSCRCMIVLVFVCMQDCDMITAECGCWFLLLLCFADLIYEVQWQPISEGIVRFTRGLGFSDDDAIA